MQAVEKYDCTKIHLLKNDMNIIIVGTNNYKLPGIDLCACIV